MVVYIKLGRDGKRTEFDENTLNIKRTFGEYAVLLNKDQQVVPLKANGEPLERLQPDELYIVELLLEEQLISNTKRKWQQFFHKQRLHKLATSMTMNSNGSSHSSSSSDSSHSGGEGDAIVDGDNNALHLSPLESNPQLLEIQKLKEQQRRRKSNSHNKNKKKKKKSSSSCCCSCFGLFSSRKKKGYRRLRHSSTEIEELLQEQGLA